MPEIVQGLPQNEVHGNPVNTHSRVPLQYNFFNTYRFGIIAPHYWFDAVQDDRKNTLRCSHDVRTYTMKAPLLQDVKMRKEYFMVYKDAILPYNWDKIITNPPVGDDVDATLVGTSVANFTTKIKSFLTVIKNAYNSETVDTLKLKQAMRFLITAEMFYSNGCLLANLGVHLNRQFKYVPTTPGTTNKPMDFDNYFDKCLTYMVTNIDVARVTIDGTTYDVNFHGNVKNGTGYPMINVRRFLEMLRQDLPTLDVTSVSLINTGANKFLLEDTGSTSMLDGDYPIDIVKCLAYQIVCAHFFTNDKVDYIYSAEMYRQYIHALVKANAINDATFTYNGINIPYDYCSAYYFNQVIAAAQAQEGTAYLIAIFQFRESLRFMDYFVGGRTRPLAVGNVNVQVSGNSFSVIDVTKNIQAQRFLNFVNRTKRQLSEYMKAIGNGVQQHMDYHDPIWIGSTEDVIHNVEVENTGQGQLTLPSAVTSAMHSNAEKYAFEIESTDRPCVILGLTYFDVSRSYFRSIEKQNFHVDRYDFFNPFMQFIGDQRVIRPEIDNLGAYAGTFAYQTRHAEYKQRFHQAAGGFVDVLPGWCYLDDYDPYEETNIANTVPNIGPVFIRSHAWEFDRFYLSLSGYSMGHYFHFIIVSNNNNEAVRPMAFNPQIL